MNARHMNAKYLILAVAIAAPLGALAELPGPATTEPASTLLVHCEYGTWPTHQQVARRLQIPSVTVGEAAPASTSPPLHASEADAKVEVRRAQQFIRRQGRYECEQGATHVQVDFHPQARHMPVAVVAGTSP